MADIRERKPYNMVPLTGVVTLHCFACGRERIVDSLTQREILNKLKKPGDYHIIECACGETQFILKKRFVIVKKEAL